MSKVQELIVYVLQAIGSLENAVDVLAEKYDNQFKTNCMGFVSLTILLWDHIVTFGDEVEYVWKGTNGPSRRFIPHELLLLMVGLYHVVKYLFLLNRYLIPLGFSINIFAYLSPALSNEVPGSTSAQRCATFVRFEGSMTVVGINIVAIMIFYRVYVLYWGSWSTSGRCYVYILAGALVVEFGMNAWLLAEGIPATGGRGCEMIFNPKLPKAVTSSSAWLPLLYDTLAFLLIFRKTFKKKVSGSVIIQGKFNVYRQLLEDGLLYYCPILAVTLSLSLMIALAPPGFQNIVAQLELIITVTMMSRISINLKKAYRHKKDIDTELAEMSNPVSAFVVHARAQIPSFVSDTTRSGIQNGSDGDLEMVTRECNSELITEVDVEAGRQRHD